MADRLLHFILHNKLLVLSLIALLTAPAAWSISRAEFAPSIIESFVKDPQDYLTARDLNAKFASNSDNIIWLSTVEGEQLFEAQTLRSIQSACRKLAQLAEVERVHCLPDAPARLNIHSSMGGVAGRAILNAKLKAGQVPDDLPRPSSVLSSTTRQGFEPSQLKQDVLSSDSPARQFVSKDGSAHLIVVEVASDQTLSPSQQIGLTQRLQSITAAEGLGQHGLFCSGLIPLQAYAFEEIGRTLTYLLPIGGLLIAIAVTFVFHRIAVCAITLLIASVSICWGFYLGILVFGKLSVLMAAAPLMVLVISTADVIHLASAYTVDRQSGESHDIALRKMFREVGKACLLTSLTTFVGFASLTIVPSNTIRQFGLATATGVASALLLSIVLMPMFLDWLHRKGRPLLAAPQASHITFKITAMCLSLGSARPKWTLAFFMVLLSLAALQASSIRLDPDLTTRFSGQHPIPRSTTFFQEQFHGTNSIELVLQGPPESLLQPRNFEDILEFSAKCRETHGISQITSIAHVMSGFISQLDYRTPTGIPDSIEHARAVLETLNQIQPTTIASLVTEERDQFRLVLRIPQTSYLEMLRVADSVAAEARNHFGGQLDIIEKGSTVVVGRAVKEIIRGHFEGFILCFVTIFALIALGLRSWRLACLSILPNLTPLLVLGGLLGWLTDVADSDLLAVATLGLGLAVDDTIHFLSRFKIEVDRGNSTHSAVAEAMSHTGSAIIRTTLILSVGFVPFAFSDYWSINMLGTYLIAVLFAAVLADLVLLPAILVLGWHPATANRPEM